MYYSIYARFFENEEQNVKAITIFPDLDSALINYHNNVSSSMIKEGIVSFLAEVLNEHGAIERDWITGGEYRTYWEKPQPEPEPEPDYYSLTDEEINNMKSAELKEVASAMGIANYSSMTVAELKQTIKQAIKDANN